MNCTNNWWPGPDRTGDLRFSGGGAADTNVFQLFRSGQIAPIGRSGPPSPPVWPHFRPINPPTTCPDVAAPRHRAQRSRRAVGAASSTRPHGAVTLVSGSGDGSVSAMGSPAGLAVPRRSAEWRTSTRDQWIPKPCDVTTPGVAHFHCATIRLAVSTLRRQLGNSITGNVMVYDVALTGPAGIVIDQGCAAGAVRGVGAGRKDLMPPPSPEHLRRGHQPIVYSSLMTKIVGK